MEFVGGWYYFQRLSSSSVKMTQCEGRSLSSQNQDALSNRMQLPLSLYFSPTLLALGSPVGQTEMFVFWAPTVLYICLPVSDPSSEANGCCFRKGWLEDSPTCFLHLSNSLLIPSVLRGLSTSLTPTPPLRRKRSTVSLLTGFSSGLLSSTDQQEKDGKGKFLLTGRNIAYYDNLLWPGKNQHFETFFRGVWIICPSHPTVHLLLLMKEILHQLIGSLFHCLQGCIHPKWWSPHFFHQQ